MAKIKKIKLPGISNPYDIFDNGAVRYDGSVTLTTDQMTTARNNIGAGTSSLEIGNTSSTAAAGNHSHSNIVSQANFNNGVFSFKNSAGVEQFNVQLPIYNGEVL